MKEIRKDFNELRRKFSKKEADKYTKAFYDIKNYRHLYTPDIKNFRHILESEIKEVRKNLDELKKVLNFKNLTVILIASIMKILIIMMLIMILQVMMNKEKLF